MAAIRLKMALRTGDMHFANMEFSAHKVSHIYYYPEDNMWCLQTNGLVDYYASARRDIEIDASDGYTWGFTISSFDETLGEGTLYEYEALHADERNVFLLRTDGYEEKYPAGEFDMTFDAPLPGIDPDGIYDI